MFETDRLVIRDPNTGLAYRGPLWAMGRICASHDLMGTRFTVWVRNFTDIIPTTAATTRDAYAARPQVTGIEVSFDEEAEVVVSASGDFATANMYVTVGDGSAPSDPTAGTNDGQITGRTGFVSTGVKVTTGNDAFVKVVGANLNGVLGDVDSAKHGRLLGVFHKDATVRSHTGDTDTTTLETITVPANTMGSEGAIRLNVHFDMDGTAGAKNVSTKFGGTTMNVSFLSSGILLLDYEVVIFNNGATNAQITRFRITYNTGAVVLATGSTSIDTTSDADLVVTVQLNNAADTGKVLITMAEYLGQT